MPILLGACGSPWAAESPAGAAALLPEGLERAAEVAAFDGLLAALEAFGRALASAASLLQAAPPPLLRELERAFPSGQLLRRFSAAFSDCNAKLEAGQQHIQAVQRLVTEARARSAGVKKAVAAREAAWLPKIDSDARAEVLGKRFGRKFGLEEKKERLHAKHNANEEFRRRTEQASDAINALLGAKWDLTARLMVEVCGCYAALFGDAQPLADGFSELAAAMPQLAPSFAPVPALSVGGALAPVMEVSPAAVEEAAGAKTAAAAGESTTAPGGVGMVAAPQTAAEEARAAGTGEPASDPAAGTLPGAGGSGLTRQATVVPVTPSPAAPRPSAALVRAPPPQASEAPPFSPGDKVEVWSSTEQAWLDGVVDEVYKVAGVADGYRVPAGVVKVSFDMGTKYIRPEQFAAQLRKPAAGVQ